MKEKKELKRYYLIEYVGTRTKLVKTKGELDILLKAIKSYNSKDSNKYLYGNMTINELEDGYEIVSHLYNKLTNKSTISDIDNLTSCFNEKSLIELYKNKLKTLDGFTPDINIAYFDNKKTSEDDNLEYKIKYIPVMYSDDICYINRDYIKKCIKYHTKNRNYAFFTSLANRFYLTKQIAESREKMYKVVDEVQFQNRNEKDLYYTALELYDSFIRERDRNGRLIRNQDGEYIISKRRQRDFGFYIRDYKILDSKIPSPLRYNKSISSIKKKELENLREELESIKEDNSKKLTKK